MRIYDTTKKLYRQFNPSHTVKIYVCGITPYASAHMGHIFTFMTYDLLQRRLEDGGHEVQMVRNITDVDDPLYVKAAELNTDYISLAKAEVASFHKVLHLLNFRPTYAEPRASQYITEMADSVKILLDKGYAYYVNQDIYFDTSKYPNYGKFSRYSPLLLNNLLCERGGDPFLETKRQPLDFLLWKNITDSEDAAQWQTVLGTGRPGWHIECSVMSEIVLGDSFDIHGGGTDLIFPHHESEIAQNVALHGSPLADHWMHVAPMIMAGEKMSKSLGNMVFAMDLLKVYEPAVIRLALMHYHHHIGGEWKDDFLNDAQQLLARVRASGKQCDDLAATKLLANVREALDDDINTLEVINVLQAFVGQASRDTVASDQEHPLVKQTLNLLGLV